MLAASVHYAAASPEYGMFFGCPCLPDNDAAQSTECNDCIKARCNVGASTIESGCTDKPWCLQAASVFRTRCGLLGPVNGLYIDATPLCLEVDSCGEACTLKDAACEAECEELETAARKNCASFAWPVPQSYTWPTTPPLVTLPTTTIQMNWE